MSLIPSGELKVKTVDGTEAQLAVSMSLIPSGELKVPCHGWHSSQAPQCINESNSLRGVERVFDADRNQVELWAVSMSLIPSGELKVLIHCPYCGAFGIVSMSLIPSGELKVQSQTGSERRLVPLYQ
mgnify:CR=1 FL=1